jgi:uncharacterized protein YlaN (UPF0358 family)
MQTISIGHRGGSLDGTTLDYDEIDEVIKVQVAEETWHDCQAVYGIMHFEHHRLGREGTSFVYVLDTML